MSATDRTPTTRILTLAVLFVAAGVFCLRALDLFSAPHTPAVSAQTVGNALERELVYLVTPIVGDGNVRISVTGGAERTFLVLINDAANVSGDTVTSLVKSAADFNPATDTLNLQQVPFANNAAAALSALQILELAGLGLICIYLTASLLLGETAPAPREAAPARPAIDPDAPRDTILKAPQTVISPAAQQAAADPDGTVRVLRQWMNLPKGPQ